MLGLITQRGNHQPDEFIIPEITAEGGIKEAMRTLALHLRTVEQAFSGPSPNEIVIDPIALYSLA